MLRKGSEGKVDGAFGPEGCIEGLCPQRGNDSLHFARRFAPSPSVVTDSLDFQVANAPLQIQFASASTAVTDSLDFQVADAPLQIQFASAKCVRCASTGKVVAQPPKGGASFPSPVRAVLWFYHNGAPLFSKGAHHGLCLLSDSDVALGPVPRSGRPLREYRKAPQAPPILIPTTIPITFLPTSTPGDRGRRGRPKWW